ncbi:DUF4389 domain-containing protein [Nocardioides sp. WL0053]|uniref:DUF4389 domain-containing protein n=1 Tax=Nocardioides jiangsuensis TaxID=2866161 RepID=A0ABS7RHE7_9ACTN|nr:DUF4389 domain-containing protein [Nocardioides jiangsuensis]MBY9074460.1 DUF4389 domain-containing protein [Nocardioides jiangsuensis]
MRASVYPVHVDATLDAGLNRWLWLVKWVLVIPHYVVLVFLWLAFAVLSIAAFLSILVTGRYPRAIFDFDVGVMRWSWRVAYYAYGALGTDRYPPFTLAEVPDYPAHLTVDYPERLSRGLVLVKWWLLALPHYLVVAFFLGSGFYVATEMGSDNGQVLWGGGLIGLLVLIAAVVLLFTGVYPRPVYDLVLGMNRWVLRVAAYAALMTDEYPPFRLDMGEHDPGPGQVAVAPPAPPPPGAAAVPGAAPAPAVGAAGAETTPPATPGWTTGRVVAVVLASLLFLVAGGLLAGGTTLAVADQTMRNDRGFMMTPTEGVGSAAFAVTSEPIQLETGTASDAVPRGLFGEVSVEVTPTGDQPVFVGVAEAADAARYLDGVGHSTLLRFAGADGDQTPVYRQYDGGAPSVLPGDSDIWTASASGTGDQQLTWDAASGDWVVVLMNADGSRDVAADVAVGATVPALGWLVAGLLAVGGVLLLISVATLALAIRGASRRTPGQT